MKMSKELQKTDDLAKETDSYWIEKAKLDFSVALEKQRKSAGLSYAAIAKKISSSAAYISKVFRGDSNLTIESMVKLARSSGGQLSIQVLDEKALAAPRWDHAPARTQQAAPTRAVVTTAPVFYIPPRIVRTECEALEEAA